jgi:hypothetical protein
MRKCELDSEAGCWLLGLLFDSEDGDSMFFRNGGELLYSNSVIPWKLNLSHDSRVDYSGFDRDQQRDLMNVTMTLWVSFNARSLMAV